MFWEKKLHNWAGHIRNNIGLPLRVDLWNGTKLHLGHDTPQVIIRIPDFKALSCLFTPTLSSLGSAYVEGRIDLEGTPQDIISIGNALAKGASANNGNLIRKVRRNRTNNRKDREAVQYHYDVSNDFYRLWLDENMVYSCAYFEHGNEDLRLAQTKKIDHILNKIQLQPGQTLLDIGCGWGALLMRAAKQYGAKCVGVTLSQNQEALARKKVAEAGLSDRIEIRLQDYRDVTGQFDRITSVGMFEHVGLHNLSGYFQKINSLLADDGIALNHGITSTDANNGETPHGNGDFIENYVFPQGQLPHISTVLNAMQEGGLETMDVENLRRHYAATCSIWASNFESRANEIRTLVGEKKFRIWRVYLAGCAYAFNQDWISLFQVLCHKSGQHPSLLPWSRNYIYNNDSKASRLYVQHPDQSAHIQFH